MSRPKTKPQSPKRKPVGSSEIVGRRDPIPLDGPCPRLKSPHPFPARMAMEIVWDALRQAEEERTVAAPSNDQAQQPSAPKRMNTTETAPPGSLHPVIRRRSAVRGQDKCDACNGWGWLLETGYGRVRNFDCNKCGGTGRKSPNVQTH